MSGLPKIEEKIESNIDIVDVVNGEALELHSVVFDKDPKDRKHRVKNVKFDRCLFSKKEIKGLIFNGCIFDSCQFNGAKIKDCEFHQCEFVECVFYKAEVERTYLDPSSFKYSSRWYIKWANVNAWWYQALFQNAKKMHQEDFAMKADRKFLFYKRYEYLFGKKRSVGRFLLGLIYDMALGCGYGVLNTMIVTCVFIVLFAFLMASNTSMQHDAGILESIYFSVVSFTTVGYGEITPVKNVFALVATTSFLFLSVVWGSIVTAVIVKRVVK